jgi:hypothetical protein
MPTPEPEDVAKTLRTHSDPVLRMREILEDLEERDLGASDTHVRELLRVLERTDEAESKKVGANATAWWSTERVKPPVVEPQEHPDQAPVNDLEPDAAHDLEEPDSESVDGDAAPDGAVEQLVADLWLWLEDRPPTKSHGRQATADVFRALLEADGRPVESSELKEVVYRGREEKWSTERAAWESVRRYLGDLPGVESSGGGEWSVDRDQAGRELAKDR